MLLAQVMSILLAFLLLLKYYLKKNISDKFITITISTILLIISFNINKFAIIETKEGFVGMSDKQFQNLDKFLTDFANKRKLKVKNLEVENNLVVRGRNVGRIAEKQPLSKKEIIQKGLGGISEEK